MAAIDDRQSKWTLPWKRDYIENRPFKKNLTGISAISKNGTIKLISSASGALVAMRCLCNKKNEAQFKLFVIETFNNIFNW